MIDLDGKMFVIIFWLAISAMLAAAAINVMSAAWSSVFVLGALAATSLCVSRVRFVPCAFAMLFAIGALIDGAGFAWQLFQRLTPFYDKFSHAFSGFGMASFFGYHSYRAQPPRTRTQMLLFVVRITSYSLAIGAVWEIIEWPAGIMGDAVDTAGDLLLDLCGSAIGSVAMLWAMRKQLLTRTVKKPLPVSEENPAGQAMVR